MCMCHGGYSPSCLSLSPSPPPSSLYLSFLQMVRKIGQSNSTPHYASMLAAAVKNPVILQVLFDHSPHFLLDACNMQQLDDKLMGDEFREKARIAQQKYAVQTLGIYGNDAKPSSDQGFSESTGMAHLSRAMGAATFDQSHTQEERDNINHVMAAAFLGASVDPDQLKALVFRIIQV